MRKRLAIAVLSCAPVLPALAGGWPGAPQSALDLSLPPTQVFDPAPVVAPALTPIAPGIVDAGRGWVAASGCPRDAQGNPRHFSGSVSAGVGYTEHFGSSNFTAARLHYCTDTATDGGKAGTINVDVQVGNASGPGLARPWGWRRW
ncbi:MAG: hypothetical protein ACK40R_02490 [Thermomonas sp.]